MPWFHSVSASHFRTSALVATFIASPVSSRQAKKLNLSCIVKRPGGFPIFQFLFSKFSSHLLQLCESLDKLLRSAPRKTHANPPVVILALNSPPRPHSILRMPHLCPQHGIGLPAPLYPRPAKRRHSRCRRTSLRHTRRGRGYSSHPPRKLRRAVRILRVRLIPPRLPNFRHRPAHRLHQLTRNLRQKPRRQRRPHLLFVPKHPPVHRPRQRQRLPRPRHPHVHQPPLLLNPFLLTDRPAMRANPIFHARQEHVVKLQPLRAVQRNQRNARLALKRIRIAHQRRRIQKFRERLTR